MWHSLVNIFIFFKGSFGSCEQAGALRTGCIGLEKLWNRGRAPKIMFLKVFALGWAYLKRSVKEEMGAVIHSQHFHNIKTASLNCTLRGRFVVTVGEMRVDHTKYFQGPLKDVLQCIDCSSKMLLHCRTICNLWNIPVLNLGNVLHKFQLRSVVTVL